MLLYEYQVQSGIKNAQDMAERVFDKYDTASFAELLTEVAALQSVLKELDVLLPSSVSRGNLFRHVSFILRNLGKEDKQSSKGDIRDIVHHDLPDLEQQFVQWAANKEHYDAEFAREIGKLLKGQHLDSAVQKAFILLKERMVSIFEVPAYLDGKDLVNAIFGKNGRVAGTIPDDEREALRDLLSGLYGVFRNKYGHHKVDGEWYEIEGDFVDGQLGLEAHRGL